MSDHINLTQTQYNRLSRLVLEAECRCEPARVRVSLEDLSALLEAYRGAMRLLDRGCASGGELDYEAAAEFMFDETGAELVDLDEEPTLVGAGFPLEGAS